MTGVDEALIVGCDAHIAPRNFSITTQQIPTQNFTSRRSNIQNLSYLPPIEASVINLRGRLIKLSAENKFIRLSRCDVGIAPYEIAGRRQIIDVVYEKGKTLHRDSIQ